jgi:hypothetical protein
MAMVFDGEEINLFKILSLNPLIKKFSKFMDIDQLEMKYQRKV